VLACLLHTAGEAAAAPALQNVIIADYIAI